ncbi:hypothetical protein [Chryseobacterium hispalense]|uniref:hypothetical protein n=1 Tax=Chryseobacterium hispalense TaxID=1453492 RepID=UPI00391AE4E3
MTKKIIGILILISSYTLSAQQLTALSYSGGQLSTGGTLFKVDSPGSKRGLSYDEIKGTPYLDKTFSPARFIISDKVNAETAPARYNAYSDNIEFLKGDEVLALLPENPFTRVEFTDTNQVLVKLNIDDDLKGYFFEIVQGKNSLYKKVKAKFNDFAPAPNSYATDKPANFNILPPTYYINTEKGVIKRPSNKKEIIEQFPEKTEALNNFFKENKIRFDKEEDLKKLVNFLNQ